MNTRSGYSPLAGDREALVSAAGQAQALPVVLVVPRNGLRQWQVQAIKRAEQRHAIVVDTLLESGRCDSRVADCTVALLAAVESVAIGRTRSLPASHAGTRPVLRKRCAPRREWPHAVVISVDDGADPVRRSRQWALVINLSSGRVPQWLRARASVGVVEFRIGRSTDIDDALDAGRRRKPTIRITGLLVRSAGTTGRVTAVAGVRERTMVVSSLELVRARAALVLTRTICGATRRDPGRPRRGARLRHPRTRGMSWAGAAMLVAAALGDYARTAVDRLRSGEPPWFLAYRDTPDRFVHQTMTCAADGLTLLMPPPGRFYADPCVFDHDGADHVFFEDCDCATGKGVISWMQRVGGTFTEPAVVLERAYHLAYPFVFAHGGHVYMVPDTSAARQVQLFRATDFPRQWELAAVLLDEVDAADATLLEHDGLWWMFATVGEARSSLCDELYVYHAPSPLGPWTPHAANPVKADVRSARPAGRFFRRNGLLIRPAQNCSRSYGGSLVLCEVLELTTSRYRERVIAHLGPAWTPGNSRFHTLSFSERLEFIDGGLSTPFARQKGDWQPCVA